jgi:predicted phage tail protein
MFSARVRDVSRGDCWVTLPLVWGMEEGKQVAIIGGFVAMVAAVFAAIGVETEVIAGFNVDGLALMLLALGAALVVRGLLPSRHEVSMTRGTHSERASVTSPMEGRYGQVRLG